MNKKTLFPILILSSFLAGCGIKITTNTNSTSSNTPVTSSTTSSSAEESSSVEVKKILNITKLPEKTDYYVYDRLDFTGLEVSAQTYTNNQLTESQVITDYSLTYADGSAVQEGEMLMQAYDELVINISKEGYEGNYITFYVSDVTGFSEGLKITSAATTTNYIIGETFSSEGLAVQYRYTYRKDKRQTFSETIEDYTLSMVVDGNTINPTNYVFTTQGSYTINISYQGIKDLLTISYPISVLNQTSYNSLINLDKYEDNTISFSKDTKKMTVTFTNNNVELATGDKGYYAPDEVVNEYNVADYSARNATYWRYTPTTGEVPLLVVPVKTPGSQSKATTENWNMINKAFFGNSADLEFESLHSYYYQSSYGQLDFKGGMTGYFDPSTVDATYANLTGYNATSVNNLPQLALDWAVETYGIDPTKYDSNQDGCVDGIWLVYLENVNQYNTDTWWAYTSTTTNVGTVADPVANCFAWCSIQFLNDTCFSYDSSYYANHECDAHVLIHETGHMLGIADYYSYNSSSYYDAVGKKDMMSNNIHDHNPYTKLFYGWVTPYIVYGSSTITIESCQSENAVIVIPYDNKSYLKDANGKVCFNVYDEYLVLDYFTPNNLNAADYDCYSVNHLKGEGGRLYHVDARMGRWLGGTFDLPDDSDTLMSSSLGSLYMVISNTEGGSRCESVAYGLDESADAWDELRWISADGNYLSSNNTASASSLFKANKTFSINTFSSQFNKTTVKNDDNTTSTYYMDCLKPFSTSFKIDSIA